MKGKKNSTGDSYDTLNLNSIINAITKNNNKLFVELSLNYSLHACAAMHTKVQYYLHT